MQEPQQGTLSYRARMRLERIINTFYYLLIIAAFYCFMRYAFWLVFPFLFAFAVATALQGPMNYAHRKIRLKKSFSAVMLVLLFYILIVVVIGLIGARIWSGAKGFMDYLMAQVQNLPKMIRALEVRINQLIQWLPDDIETRVNTWLADFTKGLLDGQNAQGESVGIFNSLMSRVNLQWLKAPMTGMLTTATKIPALAIAVVITIISSFFMTSSYDSIMAFVKRQLSPKQRGGLSAVRRIMFSSAWKLLRSYAILIGVTFVELLLGLLLLRLIGVFDGKYLINVALVTAFVDILPVLGTGSVLVPWALYNLIMGNIGLGVGILIIFVVIIVVRQILEPKLIASNLGLPPIVTIAGMYIGLQLFGVIGMLIVPMLVILLKLLNDEGVLHLWKSGDAHKKPPEPKPARKKNPAGGKKG